MLKNSHFKIIKIHIFVFYYFINKSDLTTISTGYNHHFKNKTALILSWLRFGYI